jgi:hypothetical protein
VHVSWRNYKEIIYLWRLKDEQCYLSSMAAAIFAVGILIRLLGVTGAGLLLRLSHLQRWETGRKNILIG